MIAQRLWRIPKAEPLVVLSPFSVNTEKGPPEAQDAVTDLIGVLPRKRTAVFLFHHRFAAVPLPQGGRFGGIPFVVLPTSGTSRTPSPTGRVRNF